MAKTQQNSLSDHPSPGEFVNSIWLLDALAKKFDLVTQDEVAEALGVKQAFISAVRAKTQQLDLADKFFIIDKLGYKLAHAMVMHLVDEDRQREAARRQKIRLMKQRRKQPKGAGT